MWTIAAANKKFNGPLGSYDGLTDVHLAHYFSRPIRKSQLKSAKLITCDGAIIPEHKVKVQSLQYEKKKKKYNVLANAVVQNAVQKDIAWKKNMYNYLEDISNMEIVEKVKIASRKKNSKKHCSTAKASWDVLPKYDIFGLLNSQELRNKVPHLRSAPAMCSCNSRSGHKVSELKRSSSAKTFSPYVVPLRNGSSKHQTWHTLHQFVHSGKRKKKCKRKKIFNNTVDSKAIKHSATDQLLNRNRSKITLYYHGPAPLNSLKHLEQNVLIQQQHCGGNPVVVYKGTVSPNESLTFTSVLHEGFPFSITIFLDGIRDLKLSSCCVFRYLPNRRLGGSSGSFSIQNVEGGKPCMK
ncbi:glutamate-rich protein 3-like [Stegodyphus dumicola]|uniref:glutamate-rich protein 3-like n=1 Tax=Stegodyphus dumicola TaxID=202533 RepID=UPI0015B2FCAE|nr:glutamate-rich protein 3-like [Stegodyphus dumicola]